MKLIDGNSLVSAQKNALQEVFESRSHIKIDSREKSKNNQSSKIDSKRSKTREKETIREEKRII